MANKLKGEVAFTAFDAPFTLVMDFNAICEIDADLGISIEELGTKLSGSVSTIRSVFRIGLGAKHGTMTDIEAGRIIGEIGPSRAAELLAEALKAAFPEVANGTGNPPVLPAKKARAKKPAGTSPKR